MRPFLRAFVAAALLLRRGAAAQPNLNSDPRFLKRTGDSLDLDQKQFVSDPAFEISKDQTNPKLVEIGLSGEDVILQESVVLNFADGARYVGDVVNGKRHGRGVLTLADGEIYEGEFRDDKKSGKGVLTLTDGARYDGEFKNNEIHGKGVLTWADGESYEGEFVNGKMHGRGVLTLANGKESVVLNFPNGARYVGDVVNGKMHGRGFLNFMDGESYEGEFRDNKKSGKGVLTLADGESYEGEFVNGKKHGKGVLTWADGESYEGEFVNGKRHGRGVLTLTNGDRYEGEFRDGKKYDNPWTHPMVAIGAITSFLVIIYTLQKPNATDGETFYSQEEMEKAVRGFARTISSTTFDPEHLDADQKEALLLLAVNRAGEIFESLAQISYSESLKVTQTNFYGHVTAANLSLTIRSGEDVIEEANLPLEISADRGNANKDRNQFWESSSSQMSERLLPIGLLPTVNGLLTDIAECPEKEGLRGILQSFLVDTHEYEKIRTMRLQNGQTVEKNFVYNWTRKPGSTNPRLNREMLQKAVKIFREEVTNYRKEVHGEIYEKEAKTAATEIIEKLKEEIEQGFARSSDQAEQTSSPSFVSDSTLKTSITRPEASRVAAEVKTPERESS
jgi:hypothetical protein